MSRNHSGGICQSPDCVVSSAILPVWRQAVAVAAAVALASKEETSTLYKYKEETCEEETYAVDFDCVS